MQAVMSSSVAPCMHMLSPASRLTRCMPFRPAALKHLSMSRRPVSVRATAADDADVGVVGKAAIAGGLVCSPIMLLSSYFLATTGEGFPNGPGGAYGAAEGVSYLVILTIIGWSVYTKVSTGSGLPSGPSGLLGASEGFSYLALLAAIAAFGIKSFA